MRNDESSKDRTTIHRRAFQSARQRAVWLALHLQNRRQARVAAAEAEAEPQSEE
jgi:hypothetical protein